MRFADIDIDFCRLESGEARHLASPDAFEIPPMEERANLKRGQAVKLFFETETANEDGKIERTTERMWVVVNEVKETTFLGVLTNQPASISPDDDVTYLKIGCEGPFLAEQVIAIEQPPEAYVTALLSEPPLPSWPHREEI